jgi:hypothetical protein
MLDIKISPEMKAMLRDSATKAAWISEHESPNPTVCQNCGGVGYLFIFIATKGPFVTAPPVGVAHWDKDKWWVGETFAFTCPVCTDTAIHPPIQKSEYVARLPYVDA